MVLGKMWLFFFNWEWGRNSAPREGQKIPWYLAIFVQETEEAVVH